MSSIDDILAQWGVVIAIVAMAAVTYLWRGGGYFLMGFVKPHPRITRALAALPGSVILATVLPIVLKTGTAAILATAVAVAVMAWRRSDFLAVGAGLAAAMLARAAGV